MSDQPAAFTPFIVITAGHRWAAGITPARKPGPVGDIARGSSVTGPAGFGSAVRDGRPVPLVFEAPSGQKLTSAANEAEVESLVAKLERSPQVSGVSDPFTSGLVSRSGTIAYAQVSYNVAQADVSGAAHAVQTGLSPRVSRRA
ncbi:MMPL family transporter [Streptomyces sp. AC555_RSS877]|uniref:MMPL family transporter n=1 Tax=Streptomyces sp. AC555_RSS877 TaxID=2823688 RepID=UPI0020B6A5C4|nr:MMPL family transporter [Streptomyces sp. AC555_RSS877]